MHSLSPCRGEGRGEGTRYCLPVLAAVAAVLVTATPNELAYDLRVPFTTMRLALPGMRLSFRRK